jgi:signal transduction histidine kinase/CheY-like chemotaxis protein
MQSAMVLPLVIQHRTCGVLVMGRERMGPVYQPNDVPLGRALASRASVALENAMLIERIREADQKKDEFLATLAHELRNPLAPLSNALQIMEMTGSQDQRIRDMRAIMQRQVTHMNRLVDDLLDVSRITRGRIELKKENISLRQVVESAVETSLPLVEQARHELTVTQPPEPIHLQGDPTRLSQVFSNLLNNAAKYTEPGGKISLTVTNNGDHILVSVRDTGIGIPKRMQPRIFDMFTQVDSSLERSHGGLGIGLKLVKELCELHGGSVSVASEGKGKGSEFTVRLPYAAQAGAEAQAEAPAPEPGRRRVLVVDDNEASAQTLLWMLNLLGHDAQMAHNGHEALAVAREFRPQVVLLDIGLPGMSGYDVCREMRADAGLKDAVLIAQTGWGQKEHRARSKEAGFDHHLVKPVDLKTLQSLLQPGEKTAA